MLKKLLFFLLPVLVLPLVLILLNEPLSLLAARDPAWPMWCGTTLP